jgi:hypothetical protein
MQPFFELKIFRSAVDRSKRDTETGFFIRFHSWKENGGKFFAESFTESL